MTWTTEYLTCVCVIYLKTILTFQFAMSFCVVFVKDQTSMASFKVIALLAAVVAVLLPMTAFAYHDHDDFAPVLAPFYGASLFPSLLYLSAWCLCT